MAETVVGALRYDFKADTSGLKSGLADVTSSIKNVNDQLKQNNVVFAEFGKKAQQSVGLARHEMLNLTRQINDIGVSLAGGMSPFMVLVQQGGQVADIFAGSQASVGSALKNMLLNSRAASLGIVAALGTIAAAAYSSEVALEKLSDSAKALGTNRTALREFSRQVDILGVDPKTLREDMVGLAQKIREAQIAGGDFADKLQLIGINIKNFDLSKPGEFARLFEIIGEKVRTGSNELDKLNALKFFGLSAEFNRVFNEGGDAVRKFAQDSVGAVESSQKPIEEKWRELRTIASNTWKAISDTAIEAVFAIKETVTSIIDAIANAFARLSVQIEKLMAKAKFAYDSAKSLMGGEAPDANAYNERIADLNRQSDFLNMPKGKAETTLPNINVPGKTDLSVLSTGKAKSASGGSSARDEIGDYIKDLREANQIAQAEVSTFALSNAEKEKSVALIEAENIAKEQGRSLTAAQRNEITQLVVNTQGYKDSLEQLKNTQNALNDAMRQFGDFAANAMSGLITRSKKASDVLRDLVKLLASSALKGLLTGDGFIGQLMGLAGKGGQTGGLIGTAVGALSKGFVGMFAEGGSIPAGKWGIAGEKGPEAIVGPASVIPMGSGGNAAKVTVNNYSSAQVEARQMSDGEIVVLVQSAIKANNRQIPGIMASAQRRSM